MKTTSLLKKYNIAAPRYTSYPTVPYWDQTGFTQEKWLESLTVNYAKHRDEGVSLYIHLPFCESLCTYCACNTRITKNHKVELPYLHAVVKEWEMYCAALGEKPKVIELHLGGGTPTFFSAENLKLLITSIIGVDPKDTICSIEAHPDNTTSEHLHTLYALGFKRLSLGIQDFDPKVQKMINRYQTPEQVMDIMTEARALGYDSINFDLIYGLPGQTLTGISETINSVIGMMPDRIAFYSYAHVPWMRPGQRHYSDEDIPQGNEKFALYQMGRDMLTEAGYQEIGMDHFALKTDNLYKVSVTSELHRNFMGYTDSHPTMLLALGVSSISDSYTAFAQNNKNLEAYLAKINNNEFAVEKGHILTEDDLRIRQQILNLMCKGVTSFPSEIPDAIRERLAPLLEDQLIEISYNEVRILPPGRAFLRNVCMAFDERLWAQQPQTSLFSSSV